MMEFSLWSIVELIHPQLLNAQTIYICSHKGTSVTLLKDSFAENMSNDPDDPEGVAHSLESDQPDVHKYAEIDKKYVMRECKADGNLHVLFYSELGSFCTGMTSKIYKPYPNEIHEVMLLPIVHPKNIFYKIAFGKFHAIIVNKVGQIGCFDSFENVIVKGAHSRHDSLMNKNMTVDLLKGVKVDDAACGVSFSVVVDSNGKVYTWGLNKSGQLGIGTTIDEPLPVTVPIDANITHVACGASHVLALSATGDLYTWGENGNRELGYTSEKSFSDKPYKLMSGVSEISAVTQSSMSAAKVGSSVYVWGNVNGHIFYKPTLTIYSDVNAPFLLLSTPELTPTLTILQSPPAYPMKKHISKCFNEQETSDIKIDIGHKFIYAHHYILRIRSEHFLKLSNILNDIDGKKVIKLQGYSFEVYEAFLKYLYTEETGGNDMSVDTIAGLCELSIKCNLENLRWRCIKRLIGEISVDNVAKCYNIAVEMDDKVLMDACVIFAANNTMLEALSFQEVNKELCNDFIGAKIEENFLFIK